MGSDASFLDERPAGLSRWTAFRPDVEVKRRRLTHKQTKARRALLSDIEAAADVGDAWTMLRRLRAYPGTLLEEFLWVSHDSR